MPSETNARAGGDKDSRTTNALKRQFSHVEDEASDAWSRTRDVFSDVGQTLDIKGRLNRNPYGTLAAAVGVGYILGGGFFTPLTGRLVRLGLKLGVRLALVPLLNDEVASLVGNMMGGGDGDSDETSKGRGRGRQNNEGKVP
ncbi:MAG TPA: hypothetical protein VGL59_09770 [Polyangia bacterium]|jgi:hypothetical protein